VQWAVGSARRRIIDVGAGTGILTRVLHTTGHEVVPVEPDAKMRAQLESVTPELNALDGSGERIPVSDHSVDAVVAGQAYHWFDTDKAHPEIARVLKPGGIFAPMWNVRDESVAWVAELTKAAELGPDGSTQAAKLVQTFGPLFTQPERAVFEHSTALTADDLLALLHSRSHYLTSTPEHRDEIDTAVRTLTETHPDIAGHDTFELPYLTYVYRARHE
jgi:SAM-dependent methyltransferase